VRGTTINVGVRMVVEDCITCGVHFAMPDDLRDRRMDDHRNFYCPNGHTMCFTGKNTEERLRETQQRLERERKRVQATRDLLHAEERSHAATRGHVTRKRKEIAKVKAGICPVDGCHRHFTNLERHIATKHPSFKP
jgi:hypothetical protein